MDVSKTDEILADFLIHYKMDGQDPKLGTFRSHWFSIKRQFLQRGLTIDEHNFPKSIIALQERGQKLPRRATVNGNYKPRKPVNEKLINCYNATRRDDCH